MYTVKSDTVVFFSCKPAIGAPLEWWRDAGILGLWYSKANKLFIRYPSPMNIGYAWNFGSLAGVFLGVQLLTGMFLAMYYTPHIEMAFDSIDLLMRDASNGWLVRYLHANGASFFFMVVYVHMLRGLFYNSYRYPRIYVWFTGVTIYLLLMAIAFFGYVLPWGQMSFWAATVITNFITVLPVVGEDLVHWVWGGFSINNDTLNRFCVLHYMLPFLVLIGVLVHLRVLHEVSSTTELRIRSTLHTRASFYPYFVIKDMLTLLYTLTAFGAVVLYMPEVFNHSVNYIAANILVTPSHIVPEWYFLPYYAILRSVLNKTIGVSAMLLSIIIFYLLPIIDCSSGVSKIFDQAYRRFYWFFVSNFVFLGFIGSETAEFPCVEFGTMSTVLYLLLIFIVLPVMVLSHTLMSRIGDYTRYGSEHQWYER